MKNMGTEDMNLNTFYTLCVDISSNIGASFDNKYLLSVFGCLMCKNSAIKTCTYYQIIIL